jgi:peptidoglycan/LPS O-acetylase OafA/YrhL
MEMINGVHWTLYIELQFYLTICLLVWGMQRLSARSRVAGTTLVAVCGAIALAWPLFGLRHGREHYFLPYWYAFLLGSIVYWSRRGTIPRWFAWAYLGGLGVAWGAHHDSLVGAAFVTGLFIVVASEKGRMQRWLRQRPVQFLGKTSYSLYLTHSPIVGAVFYVGTKTLGTSASTQLLLVAPEIVASLAVGAIIWWFVERAAIDWSKRLRRSPAPVAPHLTMVVGT